MRKNTTNLDGVLVNRFINVSTFIFLRKQSEYYKVHKQYNKRASIVRARISIYYFCFSINKILYLLLFIHPSMSRSIWKQPFSQLKNKNTSQKHKAEAKYKSWCRASIIFPEDIGKEVEIYNGKNWAFRKIVEDMVGHKFGEFCSTRRKTVHKISKIRQASRKK